jgi:predicted O-methyltransferase YrrM
MTPENETTLQRLSTLHGWCTIEKASAMAELVLTEKPALCVEIGVFGGRSLIAQALALCHNDSGVIYGIDPWDTASTIEGEHAPKSSAWWSNVNMPMIHAHCMKAIGDFGVWKPTRIIAARAERVAGVFTDQSIDILHIDGNHSELASVRDLDTYWPKVRPAGWIWFDDTDWRTTAKAVHWLNENAETIKDVKTCRLYRKPPIQGLV